MHRPNLRVGGLLRVSGLAVTVAVVLGSVLAGSVGPAGANDPQGRPLEVRPLLLILYTDPQHPPLAHESGYYERLVATADPSIASYYRAQSQGRFTYTAAGRVSVTDADRSDPGADSRERAIGLAVRAGYDFARYDTDHDGVVTEPELTVLVIDNLSEGAGATRRVCPPAGSVVPGSVLPVRYCANVASVGHRSGLENYVHELAHTLTPAAVDLYGPAHRCLSQGLTLMSCTAGAEDDPARLMGLDPIHRRRYGWLEPSALVYRNGRTASYTLQPGAVPDPVGALISDGYAVTYRRPGGAENLIFEVRADSSFDTRLPSSGLYVWFDAPRPGDPTGLAPALIPSLAVPGEAEPAGFVLGADDCVLSPLSRVGRGRGAALVAGTYRLRWLDDRDSGTLLTVRPADARGRIRIELRPSSAPPNC